VFVVGYTEVTPEGLTVPTLWSILIEVALVTLQLKVDELPAYIFDGLAVK